jgi:hypothetical protein
MTHPITPPPELVQQWMDDLYNEPGQFVSSDDKALATRAAQWGADQELEACCELLVQQGFDFVDNLRAARRPKPPSLKEQALESVKRFEKSGEFFSDQMRELEFIRKALETIDD